MAQQVNIVYLLLCHLNRHLWFEIPGLGIFNGIKSSSYLNHIEKKIYPGKIVIEFVAANTLRTETMIQNIVAETGFEQELLEEHLAALCQTISEALKLNDVFDFIPFGTIRNYNGKEIFQQSQNNIHQEFYWMESLPIVAIELSNEEMIFPIEGVPIRKTKSKKEFWFLLSALGILWIVFLSLLFCPPSSRNRIKDNGVQLKDSTTIKKIVDSIKVPVVSVIAHDTLEKQIIDSVKIKPDTLNQLSHETIVDSTNLKELNDKIKFKPCIIIIGSYNKRSNADRMSAKVLNNGYEVYRGEFGKFHRVGIQFNCFEHDLKQMLEELKKKFHPDAWILKF